jgi:alanyl-tRNA synthetase
MASAANLLKNTQSIGGVNLIIEQLADEISVEDVRSIALDLRGKIKDGIVVLATVVSDKPLIVASVSSEAIKSGIKAGELIKTGSSILGGGGGGKDDFAQGGGTDSGSITKALAEITKVISGKIK